MLKRWAALPPVIRWLAGIAAVVLAAAVVWALLVPVPDWLAHHDVGSAKGSLHETAMDNARGRLLTLAAGVFAAGALAFTFLNFNLLRRNSEQADQWQRRTHELTEQGQVTDRYTKAIEQLGSRELDVRIGGIYALERIARDSARDHPTVMEVLTAFIREHSREPWPLPGPDGALPKRFPEISAAELPDGAEPDRWPRPDVQAALTVVGRRVAERDARPIDLSRADLAGADLAAANLRGADLDGADLAFGWLTSADLAGAVLLHAKLNSAVLSCADLTKASLAGADLTGAFLNGADLAGANLRSTHLAYGSLISAHLAGADLGGADLTWAQLSGADLTGARLACADLTNAKLSAVHFPANLGHADLDATDFTGADLAGARWSEDAPVPEGWKRDAGSGRLEKAGTGSGPAEAN